MSTVRLVALLLEAIYLFAMPVYLFGWKLGLLIASALISLKQLAVDSERRGK